jgi:hypothetical protein
VPDWYAVGVGFARNGLLVLRTIDSGQYQFFVARFLASRATDDL